MIAKPEISVKLIFVNICKVLAILILCTMLSWALSSLGIRESNILMVYLIGVLVVIIETRGYFWGILASVLCVFVYNFFFTQPLYTFRISDRNYLTTFFIFFIVSSIASTLSSKLQRQVAISRMRERETKHLYEISRSYLHISGIENIVRHALDSLSYLQEREVVCYIAQGFSELGIPYRQEPMTAPLDNDTPARWCFTNVVPCGFGTSYYQSSRWKYIPIQSNSRVLGVLGVYCGEKDLTEEESILIQTVLSQMALALEREMLYSEQEKTRLEMEKEKLRNNLLRAISHDLRTPLTGIAGSTGFIIDSFDRLSKEEIISLLTAIGNDVGWLNNLVDNLLNMTRIQDGKLTIDKRNEVVDDIVSEAVHRVSRFLKGRELSIQMPDDVLLAAMDGKLIVQVLVNLLDNAGKHTHEGAHIKLHAYRDGDEVVFAVSDDGGGIKEELLNAIFDSFVTGKGDSADGHRGIGLGLSICQAIVKAHGGEIVAYNNEQGGATFQFALPLEKGEENHE